MHPQCQQEREYIGINAGRPVDEIGVCGNSFLIVFVS
jgi:hypothetical protein